MKITFRHAFWYAIICCLVGVIGWVVKISGHDELGRDIMIAPLFSIVIIVLIFLLWFMYKLGKEQIDV